MRKCEKFPSMLRRWLVFNSVGAMGILVQMGALAALISVFGFHYLIATIVAVETAVLHNFVWHENWTWADRRMNAKNCVLSRLLYFHLANGAISLAGNIFLMQLFVDELSLHYMLAGGLSIAICSVLNFAAGDRIVFRCGGMRTSPEEWNKRPKRGGKVSQRLFLLAVSLLFYGQAAESAELERKTVQAWNAYVKTTEQRIERELASDRGFLVMDFQNKDEAKRERGKLLSGDITIKKMEAGENTSKVKIPGGEIHHWRGGVFIPDVNLDFILSRVENPEQSEMAQEDVLESKVLERFPGGLKLFLKLQRSKIVTVIYNTEHLVRITRRGARRASSTSVATKIAEVERLEGNREREKPEGNDHGFLWRMNSYWRYEQMQGGVIVECESLTLSRTVPKPLELMIGPIINRIAKESLERTLQSMRARMMSGP